jgi:hypothetical protein
MISEWMKVMLEEIAGKKAQAEQMRAEERQRAAELPGCDKLPSGAELPSGAAENAPARPGADRVRG